MKSAFSILKVKNQALFHTITGTNFSGRSLFAAFFAPFGNIPHDPIDLYAAVVYNWNITATHSEDRLWLTTE
jgi:hypothetical protein